MPQGRIILFRLPPDYIDHLEDFMNPGAGLNGEIVLPFSLEGWLGRWIATKIMGEPGVGREWGWRHHFECVQLSDFFWALYEWATIAIDETTKLNTMLSSATMRIGVPISMAYGAIGIGATALYRTTEMPLRLAHLPLLATIACGVNFAHALRHTAPDTRIQPGLHRTTRQITRAVARATPGCALLHHTVAESGIVTWAGRGNRAFHDFIRQVGGHELVTRNGRYKNPAGFVNWELWQWIVHSREMLVPDEDEIARMEIEEPDELDRLWGEFQAGRALRRVEDVVYGENPYGEWDDDSDEGWLLVVRRGADELD